jgi:hypothetical protein
MATTTAIRQGLATRLDTITGVKAYAYEPDMPVTPALIVATYDADYDLVMGAGTTYEFSIYILVNRSFDRSAQEAIDGYLQPAGSTSIAVAIDGDPTLGGIVAFAAVRNVSSSLVAMDFAGVTYAAATCRIEVVSQP